MSDTNTINAKIKIDTILSKSSHVCYERVELRSEKVRNIIGQVPPVLLRCGITVIALVLSLMVGISAVIPYQPFIDIDIVVTQSDDNTLHYSTRIPYGVVKNGAEFHDVILNSSNKLPLPTRFEIESVSNVIELSGEKAWCFAELIPMDIVPGEFTLNNYSVVVSGKILLKKQSVMMWVVDKIVWCE